MKGAVTVCAEAPPLAAPLARPRLADYLELTKPRVAVLMGSASDWEVMKAAAEALDALAIPYEARVISAHRTPDRHRAFVASAASPCRPISVSPVSVAA